MPNAWDAGSARLFASLGFHALATTSSGHALTLGRLDGHVTRDEAIEHAAMITRESGLPVSADLEHGHAVDVAGVAETARMAAQAGLAGFSVEDWHAGEFYELKEAAERVRAAAEVASEHGLVLTARAENYIHGRKDRSDTIARLRAYQEAGADVLFAPGLRSIEDISAVVAAVERPVNVLALPGVAPVAELGAAGVSRISVGGGLAFAALGTVAGAARELLQNGTYGYFEAMGAGRDAALTAFGDS
jgi:2-methylisocitrate lyase-like PEP mutase family enzyme